MAAITMGRVKDGVIVPNTRLPEGAWVRIELEGAPVDVPADLQEEFDAWDRLSAEALDNVERRLEQDEKNAKR